MNLMSFTFTLFVMDFQTNPTNKRKSIFRKSKKKVIPVTFKRTSFMYFLFDIL